jgi:hypothetical protein
MLVWSSTMRLIATWPNNALAYSRNARPLAISFAEFERRTRAELDSDDGISGDTKDVAVGRVIRIGHSPGFRA